MGPELAAAAPYISGGAAILGTVMQQQAMQDANDEQQRRIAQNQALDDQYQAKAIDLVNQNAQQYKPEQRQQAEQKAIDTASDSLTGELVAAREGQPAPSATAGKVSQDFTDRQAKTSASELARSSNIANLMARMRGPTDMRANEAMVNADFAGRGGSLANDRQAMANAGTADVERIRPDGTQMLIGGLGQSLGTSTLAGSLMKKAKAPVMLGNYSAGIDQSGMY